MKKGATESRKEPPEIGTSADTIADWMEVFRKVYQEVDSKRTPVRMWIAATKHFTTIGEAIRRMNFSDLMKAASHAFCWMCSFVLACQREKKGSVYAISESFSGIVTCKYPLVCGHCQESYCHCNPQLMDRQANKAAKYRQLLEKRANLKDAPDAYRVSQWLRIFNNIYGQHTHMLTLDSIGFHFLEEAGEELNALKSLMDLEHVLDAHLQGVDEAFLAKLATWEGTLEYFDKYVGKESGPDKQGPEPIKSRLVHAKVDMFVEFADTFSWFCSVLNKVTSIARNCDDNNCPFTQEAFQEALLREYLPTGQGHCPTCKKRPCKCIFYN